MPRDSQWYEDYKDRVRRATARYDLITTGAAVGNCVICEERMNPDEPFFSTSPCDCCGSSLGGDRHSAHAIEDRYDDINDHWEICSDCLYFINYGRLDDRTMEEINKSS